MTIKDPIEKLKHPHGGARPGSGRKTGTKNRKTLEREAAARAALDSMLGELTPEQIEAMQPLDVLLWAMRLQLKIGNIMGAASVAEKAAGFVHPKISSNALEQPLPQDMQPDPIPEPDEIGPEHPVY